MSQNTLPRTYPLIEEFLEKKPENKIDIDAEIFELMLIINSLLIYEHEIGYNYAISSREVDRFQQSKDWEYRKLKEIFQRIRDKVREAE